jgi:basic amino acid/polyamine antiporter, APA family
MAKYSELGVSDPLSYVFSKVHLGQLSGFIALAAVVAMASVLLVFQLGQPRIWMSMSRDGLLPPVFAKLHPRYRTPAFSTIITGFLVAIPALFMNLTEVIDLTSIGTLFAFVLVSGGILILNPKGVGSKADKGFVVPYFNSRTYLLPILVLAILIYYFSFSKSPGAGGKALWGLLLSLNMVPYYLFILVALVISFFAITHKWSLIPVLALLTNLYLMSELGITNWLRFAIWLVVGLMIYFSFGFKNSRLRNRL